MSEDKQEVTFISVHIMGKEYRVPAGLTIMEAFEYAGYRFTRGAGCRAGFCGACATIYRKPGDYRIYTALACQSSAEDGMYLAQLPFTPANRSGFDLNKNDPKKENTLVALYPEVARCVSCNSCSKACPQDLEVMDYVQSALRGDVEKTASLSFDCVQCGICSMRCPAEIPQYHVGQLARRLYGKYYTKRDPVLDGRVKDIEAGKYDEKYEKYMTMPLDKLKELYVNRKKMEDL